jgi:hypothetical protein
MGTCVQCRNCVSEIIITVLPNLCEEEAGRLQAAVPNYRMPLLVRGGPNRRRPAFQNFKKNRPPNYSKALPPGPPVSPYLRSSSSVYSWTTESCSQLSTSSITDFSSPPTPENPISIPIDSKLSQRLPSHLKTLSITTRFGLLPEKDEETCSPSSIEVDHSSPLTTHYSKLWSDNSPLSPLASQLLGPFDPQIPHGEDVCANSYQVSSLRRAEPDTAGNIEENTDSALSSIYQHYFPEEYEGKAGPPLEHAEDDSSRDKGDQDWNSILVPAQLSRANQHRELYSRNLDDVHQMRIGYDSLILAPSKKISVKKTEKITRSSRTISQKQGLSIMVRNENQKDSITYVERQPAALIRSSDGKQPEELPRKVPFSLHHSFSTDFREHSPPHNRPGRHARSSPVIPSSPGHVNESVAQRHFSEAIRQETQGQRANIVVEKKLRLLETISESPVSEIEGYASHSSTKTLFSNTTGIWQIPESSNSSAVDHLSIERHPITVPISPSSLATVSPLREEPGQRYFQYESRFSMDSLSLSSGKSSPSFLTKIFHHKSPNPQIRDDERRSLRPMILDIALDIKRRKNRNKRSRELKNSIKFVRQVDPREVFREG